MAGGMAHTSGRPAGGPQWRFVPRSKLTGRLTFGAGVAVLIGALTVLGAGGHSALIVTLEVVIALVGLAMITSSVVGLMRLRRSRLGG